MLDAGLGAGWEIYVQPHLNGCRPDFVLLNPKVGIGILEIKDWDLQAPRYSWRKVSHGADELIGTHSGHDFKHENPARKLRYYKQEVFDIYCPRLTAGSGLAAISAGVIFPFANEIDVHRLFDSQVTSKYEFVAGRGRRVWRCLPHLASRKIRNVAAYDSGSSGRP
jgi:hypothetical protein